MNNNTITLTRIEEIAASNRLHPHWSKRAPKQVVFRIVKRASKALIFASVYKYL